MGLGGVPPRRPRRLGLRLGLRLRLAPALALALALALPGAAPQAPCETVADVAAAGQLTTFTSLIYAAARGAPGFAPAAGAALANATAAGAGGNVTVFAPTDAAFAALFAVLNTTAEEMVATSLQGVADVLLYHMATGNTSVESIKVSANATEVAVSDTLYGESLSGEAADPAAGLLYVQSAAAGSGAPFDAPPPEYPLAVTPGGIGLVFAGCSNATLTSGPFATCTGDVYFVNAVLVPGAFCRASLNATAEGLYK